MEKKKLAVICGGESVEHQISLRSARSILKGIDRDKYEVYLIGITTNGDWYLLDENQFDLEIENKGFFCLEDSISVLKSRCSFDWIAKQIEIAFPILHGGMGEDGAIQGFLKCLHIPFVGPNVLDAAIAMDKEVIKRLLETSKIPLADFIVCDKENQCSFEKAQKKLGLPIFVKPSNSGSSLGISKVCSESEYEKAIAHAFSYDHKVILEKAIIGREIECSVLGNEVIEVSLAGEVIPHHSFYSYEAKYLDDCGASFSIPANLDKKLMNQVRNLAKKIYKLSCCQGMARIDFFLDETGKFFFNEINTIPGFTSISLYPKLWEVTGVSYKNLIQKLIDLAFDRKIRSETLIKKHETSEAIF